uniref:Uncharacterized protein n=1 Tax=Anguilla anguilla TaxID=7936 RepID=A0A0E9SUH0_ANGAN
MEVRVQCKETQKGRY